MKALQKHLCLMFCYSSRAGNPHFPLQIFLAIFIQFAVTACSIASDAPQLVPLKNLQSDLKLSAQTERPLLVMFSTSHCGFCSQVKEEFLQPILRNAAYDETVIIRLVEVDDDLPVRALDGSSIDYSTLADNYQVNFYPTILMLGPGGEELAKRLIGITTVDFYGAYLDRAIHQARENLRGEGKIPPAG